MATKWPERIWRERQAGRLSEAETRGHGDAECRLWARVYLPKNLFNLLLV